jgi:hypothetical protein
MTEEQNVRGLAEEILADACIDWVSAGEVIITVGASGLTDPDDRRDLSIGLISRLIMRGLLIPGDIEETGHRPWDCTRAEAIARITEEWSLRDDPFVFFGEIVWLDVSPEGKMIGEAVIERGEIVRQRQSENAFNQLTRQWHRIFPIPRVKRWFARVSKHSARS